jgi:hypothetical protein
MSGRLTVEGVSKAAWDRLETSGAACVACSLGPRDPVPIQGLPVRLVMRGGMFTMKTVVRTVSELTLQVNPPRTAYMLTLERLA